MPTNNFIFFRKLVLLTILFVYLVILAGGIVRSTGSGMGCPDWPKCFGQWVPPTNISELPPNYKEKFKVGNHFVADFSAFKTWVEYTNRLLGIVLGFIVLASFLYSVKYIGNNSVLFLLSFSILFLTGLQGWIGAKVVASNLANHMITIHMFIAVLILMIVLVLYNKIRVFGSSHIGKESNIKMIFLFLSLLTFVQILFGSQVRQEIDTVSLKYHETNRDLWISDLGVVFDYHKLTAILIVLANSLVAFFFIKKYGFNTSFSKIVLAIVGCLFLEYLFGVWMVRFAIPFYTQPFHLLLSTIVFGLQFYTWINLKSRNVITI